MGPHNKNHEKLQVLRNHIDYYGRKRRTAVALTFQIVGWGIILPAVVLIKTHPQVAATLLGVLSFLLIGTYVLCLFLIHYTEDQGYGLDEPLHRRTLWG